MGRRRKRQAEDSSVAAATEFAVDEAWLVERGSVACGMTNAAEAAPPLTTVERRLVGHGLCVILCAMLAGFALGISLVGGVEVFPGNIRPISVGGTPAGWARMHVGSVTNGLLLFAIAFMLPRIGLSFRSQNRIAWVFVAIAWANTIFYFFGGLAPNRGITFGSNRFGETTVYGLLGMIPGSVGAIVTVIVLVMLIKQTFRG